MDVCCHSNLTRAVAEHGGRLACCVPMCTGFTCPAWPTAAVHGQQQHPCAHDRCPAGLSSTGVHDVLCLLCCLSQTACCPAGLAESDVHDVLNVFMCTGFTRDTNQYFTKPSPVRKGDYLELLGGWGCCQVVGCTVACRLHCCGMAGVGSVGCAARAATLELLGGWLDGLAALQTTTATSTSPNIAPSTSPLHHLASIACLESRVCNLCGFWAFSCSWVDGPHCAAAAAVCRWQRAARA
jgi:hypothetical protein